MWTGVFWALVLLGAGLLIHVAFRLTAVSRRSQPDRSEARRILERRLAGGEIDAEEFSTRLRTLEEG